MRRVRAGWHRVVGTFGGGRDERELAAEFESHLQHHVDDLERAGVAPAEARRRALAALGSAAAGRDAWQDRRGFPVLENLARDLRHGLRALARNPGFSMAGVVILGLGIGLNSAIFTLVNAVVLQPLPFHDADRIVRLWHTPPQTTFAGMRTFALSPANFLDWEAQSRSFDAMAIYRGGAQTVTGRGEPEAVTSVRASAAFLPIFGVQPMLGRGFTAADDHAGTPDTVLLSEGFWRRRFGADPAIVGRTIQLDLAPHTVIGVVPTPSFLDEVKVWMPLHWTPADRARRANHNYRAVGRLKPGVALADAQAELDAISLRLAQAYPVDNKDWGALVVPMQDDIVGDARTPLLVLLGAVALVLLIACANLANLMLARTHGRAREIALRGALGASRWRVVQQLLAEGLLLGVGGGIAGLVAAWLSLDALLALSGTALPRAQEVSVDGRVLAFTAAIAIVTGLMAALVPAWRLTGRDASVALKHGPDRGHSGGDGRMRQGLVVSEVALALMLLIGAGLLMRSLAGLRAIDAGFDAHGVLTASVGLPPARYGTPAARNQFFESARQAVVALPGVESAAWIDSLPLTGGSSEYVAVEGARPVPESELPVVAVRLASPGYFRTARIPLRAGRDFTDADGLEARKVAVVSERAAAAFWPGQNPLGKHVTVKMMSDEPHEVVGVVGEVRMEGLDGAAAEQPAIYAPHAQFAFGGSDLMVRTRVPPESLSRAVVGAIHGVDAEQPVLRVRPMTDVVEDALGQRPFAMQLLGGFAALALLLASVGIYSVLAYTVRQRFREIGIRLALGAPVGGVLRMVIVEGLKPTLAGVAVGVALAALLVRWIDSLLFQVDRHDPQTFAAVTLVVIAVGLLATLVPAWRATRVDPVETLRAD
jgi:putative ABC transport system permease protein